MSSASRIRRFGSRHRAFGGAGGGLSLGDDTFTDVDAIGLNAHIPTGPVPGTGWTDANGVFNDLQTLNNRAALVGARVGGTVVSHMATSTVPPADQIVTAALTMFTNLVSQTIGIGARCSGAGAAGGLYLRYNQNNDPLICSFVLLRYTDGFVLTQLGANYVFPMPASGTVVPIVLRCVGNAIECDVNGVANVITGVDATIVGRQPGIMASGAGDGVNSTAATGVHLDTVSIRAYP